MYVPSLTSCYARAGPRPHLPAAKNSTWVSAPPPLPRAAFAPTFVCFSLLRVPGRWVPGPGAGRELVGTRPSGLPDEGQGGEGLAPKACLSHPWSGYLTAHRAAPHNWPCNWMPKSPEWRGSKALNPGLPEPSNPAPLAHAPVRAPCLTPSTTKGPGGPQTCPHFQLFSHPTPTPENKTQGPTSASFALAPSISPQWRGFRGGGGARF
jgi:hypothetical protein